MAGYSRIDFIGTTLNKATNLSHLDYLRLTQQDPRNHLNWLMLGWTSDDPRVALEFFEEALTLKSGDPEVLDSIRWAKERIAHPQGKLEMKKLAKEVQKLQKTYQPEPKGLDIPTRPQHPRRIYWRVLVSRRMLILWMGLYLIAISLSEILTTILPTVELGLILYGLVLLLLLVHSAIVVSRREERLLLTLAFAPLIRMTSLSIPLSGVPQMYWYMIIGIPLFLAAFLMMRLAGFSRQEVGLTAKHWWIQISLGILGLGLGYLEFLILRPAPLAKEFSFWLILAPALILLIFTGLLEEYIFRGLMQRAFITMIGRTEGVLYISYIFAILHLGYRSVLEVIFVFWVAMIFSYITLTTGSILGATLAHGMTNISLFLIFPFILAPASPTITNTLTLTPTAGAVETVSVTPTPFQPLAPHETPFATPSLVTTTPVVPTVLPTSSPLPAIRSLRE